MSLNFPSRLTWLAIIIILIFFMQGGCKPIQPPSASQPAATAGADNRPDLSTNISGTSQSPNGEWLVTTLFQIPRGSEEYYQSLVVTHAGGEPSYTIVDGWYPLALGYTVATPLQWSADGKRLYYTNRPQADGCALFYNGSDLTRLDLATGDTATLLAANSTTTLGLAPDEQQVAYHAIGEPALLIRNLASGQIIPFDLTPVVGDDQMGAIVWSPDSSALTFAVAHEPCSNGWAATTSLYTLDAQTLTLTAHLQQDERLLIPIAWPAADTMLLQNQAGQQFTLDLPSNSVTPALASALSIARTSNR